MTVYFPTVSPAEFEKALRICCLRQAARDVVHPTINPFTHGDEFAVRYGPFLVDVAKQAGLSLPQARRRMKVLQDDGRVLRDDAAGGRTRWWLAGLSAELRPQAQPTVASTPARQTLTHVTVPARQHWSDVLGVARDCSTSEARAAFQSAVAALDQADPDYPNQSRRVRDAIDACCRDHEIQIEE